MKTTAFLIRFTCYYVPLAICLLAINFTMQFIIDYSSKMLTPVPQKTKEYQTNKEIKTPPKPSPSQETTKPKPPRFYYLVELKSGGSMKAKAITDHGDQLTLHADNGYDVILPKADVKTVQKIRL